MDTIQFDHKRFGDIIKTIKSCYEKSHERIFDKNLFVDLWNIINDLLNLIEIHQTNLTDEDFEMIENECYLLIKFKNPDSDDEINIDLDSAKSLFYKFFNFFNRDFIQNDLKDISMPNDHLTNISCFLTNRISWSNLRLHYIICLEMHSDDEDRPTNFLELLSLILNKIKKLARCPDLNDIQQDTLKHFSYMIFNHTNATNSIPQFIQSQFAQQIIDLLNIIIEQENRYLFFEKSILNTIFNISRHDQGIEWLNQFNTTELILKFPNTHQDTNVTTTCSMILALLSTPEQIKHQKYLTDVFDHLLQHTFHASVDKRFMSESYHISEILLVFVKLFNDDRTANYILEQSNVDLQTSSTTEFFIEFFIRYYSLENNHDPLRQTTITALVNIFWSISFQDKYKQILQQAKPQFKQFIENLSKQTNENSSTNEYIPHFLENIPKAAACILTNLNDSSKYLSKSESSKKTRSQPKIMISYSHEDQQICKQLHEIMIDQGFQTWVDFECLKGGDDLWEEIAIGMMDADVIFCLISDQYCKSKSCRQEAVYALEKLKEKKLILPIYLQQPQLPPWLEIRMSDVQYVRFKDRNQLEDKKLSEITKIIQHKLTPSNLSQSIITNENVVETKSVEQWNQSDIDQWFDQNQIRTDLKELCQFKDGQELICYTKIFLQSEKLQFYLYSKEFLRSDGITNGQKPLLLHEFTKFSCALRRLQSSFQ